MRRDPVLAAGPAGVRARVPVGIRGWRPDPLIESDLQ